MKPYWRRKDLKVWLCVLELNVLGAAYIPACWKEFVWMGIRKRSLCLSASQGPEHLEYWNLHMIWLLSVLILCPWTLQQVLGSWWPLSDLQSGFNLFISSKLEVMCKPMCINTNTNIVKDISGPVDQITI